MTEHPPGHPPGQAPEQIPEESPGQPSEQTQGGTGSDAATHADDGLDLARSIARGLARAPRPEGSGRREGATGRPRGARRRTGTGDAYSGAHPDARDPQTIDAAMTAFVAEHGWDTELRVHGVFSRWEAIVGQEVGRHARPESFADGRLTVRTDSTAWATQMKLLAADVVRRLNEVLGDGTVEVIDVRGPNAPSWKRGRLRVKGRGPRDTYG